MAIFAVWHVGIGNRRYKPGERLPEMDDATWKRLAEAGAIRTAYEENPPTSADFDNQAEARFDAEHEDPADETGPSGATQDEEDDEEEELPEIDAAEGIVEEEEQSAKTARRKKARA